MKTTHKFKSFFALALASLAPFAHGHIGAGPTSGFLPGVVHPITGLDHVCAMVAVGLWAAQRGGRAIWAIPLTFVAVMAIGGMIGMVGLTIPFLEKAIVLSVLVLGVLVAAAIRLPLLASMLIVGAFAVFHGHAHGAEMPHTVSGVAYGFGFATATATLHAIGIALGLLLKRFANSNAVRYAGGGIAAYGLYLLAA